MSTGREYYTCSSPARSSVTVFTEVSIFLSFLHFWWAVFVGRRATVDWACNSLTIAPLKFAVGFARRTVSNVQTSSRVLRVLYVAFTYRISAKDLLHTLKSFSLAFAPMRNSVTHPECLSGQLSSNLHSQSSPGTSGNNWVRW